MSKKTLTIEIKSGSDFQEEYITNWFLQQLPIMKSFFEQQHGKNEITWVMKGGNND